MKNPLAIAIQGKGVSNALKRGRDLVSRYDLGGRKMTEALELFADTLDKYGYGATFPITSSALKRNPSVIQSLQARGIEFAIHGLNHDDYSELIYDEQYPQLTEAQRIFNETQIEAHGFRAPYLRWNTDTINTLKDHRFLYDSSQALAWDIGEEYQTESYRHTLQFYGARSTNQYPSLPEIDQQLVRIPYNLPDDEALVERLKLPPKIMCDIWIAILQRTYRMGELFTIGLHPERIWHCQEALEAVLEEAQQYKPAVWVATLYEISKWWRERTQSQITIEDLGEQMYGIKIEEPETATVMARKRTVEVVDVPISPWAQSYMQIHANTFKVKCAKRPAIGLSPHSAPRLGRFLEQQGYIVEFSEDRDQYAYYFDQQLFVGQHQRFLLAQIEGTEFPLVRLGRWPNGARSAIAITGDIDALSLWDYLSRAFN